MRSNESIHLRPPSELVREIDEYRRSKLNPPSRPRAIEELLQAALTARAASRTTEITDLTDA